MDAGMLLADWLPSLPWETLGAAIISIIVGIAVTLVIPGLRSTLGTFVGRLHRFATLRVWPVAHKTPQLKLDPASIVCTRHLDRDGAVDGYSLRLKCSVNNTGQGAVLISRNGIAAILTSNDDRRKSITFDSHPFTHSVLGPGDGGADMPSIRVGPKEEKSLDLGLVTYWPLHKELPGERLDGQLAVRLELTPRPGRDAIRYRDALHPHLTIPFSLQSSHIVEEVDNWLDTKVALAQEIGATEGDIRNRLLPRWHDDDDLKKISPF